MLICYRPTFSIRLTCFLFSFVILSFNFVYVSLRASLVAQMVKNLPAKQRPSFNPQIGKISWRSEWLPTPVFLPREFHGQKKVVVYSPWGHQEWDTTEWLTLSLSLLVSLNSQRVHFVFSIICLLNSSTVLLVVILNITTIIFDIILDTSCLHHFLQYYCCSVPKLCQTLWPHGLQHTRLPCPSPSPGICWNSGPLSWWYHPTISSSTVPFSSYLQSFPVLLEVISHFRFYCYMLTFILILCIF